MLNDVNDDNIARDLWDDMDNKGKGDSDDNKGVFMGPVFCVLVLNRDHGITRVKHITSESVGTCQISKRMNV